MFPLDLPYHKMFSFPWPSSPSAYPRSEKALAKMHPAEALEVRREISRGANPRAKSKARKNKKK